MKIRLSPVVTAIEFAMLAVCMLIAVSRPAHAYLDPGSGSYALQLGVAGLLGAAFSLKLTWRRIAQAVVRSVSASREARAADQQAR